MSSIPVRVGDARCLCQDCDLLSNPHGKCGLRNTVHSIWRYDNFWLGHAELLALEEPGGVLAVVGSDGRVRPETYQRMEPALQLATLLLQRARPFLMRLMFAELLSTGVLDEAYQADSARETQYDTTMLELADNVMTCTTEPSHEAEAVSVRCPAAGGVVYMMLHPRHYEALASDSWPSWDFKDRHQHLSKLSYGRVTPADFLGQPQLNQQLMDAALESAVPAEIWNQSERGGYCDNSNSARRWDNSLCGPDHRCGWCPCRPQIAPASMTSVLTTQLRSVHYSSLHRR